MTINKKYIDLLRGSTERGAYGAFLLKGKNDKLSADRSAVDKMRKYLNGIDMKGRIVIGEGELDEAPMLHINEKVGNGTGDDLDIAVDPLEGTNFAAKNLPNAMSVLASTEKNNMLCAPETYMEKIAIGSGFPDKLIDLDFDIKKNIERISDAKNTSPEKITVCILDRPRHNKITKILRDIGVKINFITDGDVSGVMSVAYSEMNVDVYLGIGGGPEGVLAAAALSCLGCQMQTRLIFQNDDEKNRANKAGILDLKKKYNINDMIKGDVIFSMTGVTDGSLVKGIKDFGDYFEAETMIFHKNSNTNKKIINKIKK